MRASAGKVAVRAATFSADHDIGLRCSTAVTSIDPMSRPWSGTLSYDARRRCAPVVPSPTLHDRAPHFRRRG